MKKSKQILITIIFVMCVSVLKAETLFEIKDSSNYTVFNISDDGLRVFNLGDTLMVISADAIRANIGSSKGLSRSFSVTTTSSVKGKGLVNAFEVGTDSTKIGTVSTTMGNGEGKYTDFSPDNIFIGLNAGSTSMPGYGNVFIGNDAGKVADASMYSTFIGNSAGAKTVGGIRNTFVGNGSGYENYDGYSNTFCGDYSGFYNTSGFYNNFFGHESGYHNTSGHSNTAFGFKSGYGTTGAEYYFNCLFGSLTGLSLTTGSSNIFVGYYTGYRTNTGSNNIYIGEKAGYNNQTGTGNIFLGYNAGYNETGSNRLYIDNSNTADPLIYGKFDATRMVVINGNSGDNTNSRTFFVNGSAGGTGAWNNDSDKRLKHNIETIGSATDKVMKLRGVTFEWNDSEKYEKGKKMGFIAQEAAEVIPEVVDYNEENDRYTMQYAPVTALLVEALKEQNREILELKNQNLRLYNEIEDIKKLLNLKGKE